ncbi:MAG: hypothetical protein EP329_02980 [Deltaproteobacteria bacterium]|nr:MAG: hypothetical protein EP329_02980 [Deltaproteobacteria bacterium]
MRRRIAQAALVLLVAGLGACDLEPDVGPPTQYRCIDEDSDPSATVSWSRDIAPLLRRAQGGCARCHDPASSNPIGVQLSGLDLSSLRATREGGARSGTNIVVPGAPCQSVLYLKVLTGPPFGGRMPLDGPPFLSTTELDLVHDWIAEGAHDN